MSGKFSDTEIYNLHALIIRIDKIAESLLQKNIKLSYMDFLVLLTIEEHPSYTQQHIADFMNLTKSAVSKRIEGLVQRKLLSREPNPKNRRENILQITTAGADKLSKSYEILKMSSDPLFDSLKDGRGTFGKNLKSMLQTIESK